MQRDGPADQVDRDSRVDVQAEHVGTLGEGGHTSGPKSARARQQLQGIGEREAGEHDRVGRVERAYLCDLLGQEGGPDPPAVRPGHVQGFVLHLPGFERWPRPVARNDRLDQPAHAGAHPRVVGDRPPASAGEPFAEPGWQIELWPARGLHAHRQEDRYPGGFGGLEQPVQLAEGKRAGRWFDLGPGRAEPDQVGSKLERGGEGGTPVDAQLPRLARREGEAEPCSCSRHAACDWTMPCVC